MKLQYIVQTIHTTTGSINTSTQTTHADIALQ